MIFFINKNYIKKFEPLFQILEETYILPQPNAEEFAPEILQERVKIIGTILGFDKTCIGHTKNNKESIGIFFFCSASFWRKNRSIFIYLLSK